MGAQVQCKTYFPGSMTDRNNGFHNGTWDLHHNDKSQNISGPANSHHYDYFPTMPTMDANTGYAKEQIRQTILKQDSIFRHQIQELHRLYKKQRDLMSPMPAESHILATSIPMVDSSFSRVSNLTTDNTFSPLNKGKSTLNDFGSLISKCGGYERRVIDLEQPADENNEGKLLVGNLSSLRTDKGFNLADLNKPIQVEERETTFSAFFGNKSRTGCFAEEPQKRDSSAKRTIFGFEYEERNQTPPFHPLPWKNTTSVQNASTPHYNRWINSSDSTSQIQGFFAGNSRLTTNSTRQNHFSGLSFLNGVNSKDQESDNLEEINAKEKHRFLNMWKNHETPEQTLPHWLTAKPCLQSEQIKRKETPVHHINLDSLQNHSQQFFKKVKTDDTQSITKILGVPIIDPTVESQCDTRHHFDLNMSLDDEDAPPTTPSLPESVVKIATMEIDLEAPAVLESDTDEGSMDNHVDLAKAAAEAIVSMSFTQPPGEQSSDTLLWFAELITSSDCKRSLVNVSEDIDYFEYMTLKLEDSGEIYDLYKPMIVEEEQKEDDSGSLSKRTPRKGQGKRGRYRKDFQREILPSIITLSRREVTEDLQILEEALSSTGVSWQSSMSKRRSAARNSRGKWRFMVPPPPAVVAKGGEKSVCREIALEKNLGGWGRRTRRLPRQRCQNGGNHQSLALKCYS